MQNVRIQDDVHSRAGCQHERKCMGDNGCLKKPAVFLCFATTSKQRLALGVRTSTLPMCRQCAKRRLTQANENPA